jgi:hypothetical protein
MYGDASGKRVGCFIIFMGWGNGLQNGGIGEAPFA